MPATGSVYSWPKILTAINPYTKLKRIKKILKNKLSRKETRKLIEKVTRIREEIWKISDDQIREELFSMFDPIIYDDAITLKNVKSSKKQSFHFFYLQKALMF